MLAGGPRILSDFIGRKKVLFMALLGGAAGGMLGHWAAGLLRPEIMVSLEEWPLGVVFLMVNQPLWNALGMF